MNIKLLKIYNMFVGLGAISNIGVWYYTDFVPPNLSVIALIQTIYVGFFVLSRNWIKEDSIVDKN